MKLPSLLHNPLHIFASVIGFQLLGISVEHISIFIFNLMLGITSFIPLEYIFNVLCILLFYPCSTVFYQSELAIEYATVFNDGIVEESEDRSL